MFMAACVFLGVVGGVHNDDIPERVVLPAHRQRAAHSRSITEYRHDVQQDHDRKDELSQYATNQENAYRRGRLQPENYRLWKQLPREEFKKPKLRFTGTDYTDEIVEHEISNGSKPKGKRSERPFLVHKVSSRKTRAKQLLLRDHWSQNIEQLVSEDSLSKKKKKKKKKR